jgi:hypothetical protein
MCKLTQLMKIFKIKTEKDMMTLQFCSTLFLYKQTHLLILHMQEIAWYTTWDKRYYKYHEFLYVNIINFSMLRGNAHYSYKTNPYIYIMNFSMLRGNAHYSYKTNPYIYIMNFSMLIS